MQIVIFNPVVITPAAEKQKGLSLDRPYIFVFYRNMKVKKGRRLVRSSVMLKRTAAMVPRVIKAGLSCNSWSGVAGFDTAKCGLMIAVLPINYLPDMGAVRSQ